MNLAPIKALVFFEWIIFIFLCIGSVVFIPKDLSLAFMSLIFLCAVSTTLIYFNLRKNKKI